MIELRSANKKLKLWRVQFLEIKGKILNKQSIAYHHQIEIQPRVSEIERKTLLAGRFILGTNQEFIAQKYCGTIKPTFRTSFCSTERYSSRSKD